MSGIASSSIILAGSEEQINFPSNLPKCLKWLQKAFIHALLLCPCCGFAFTSVCRK